MAAEASGLWEQGPHGPPISGPVGRGAPWQTLAVAVTGEHALSERRRLGNASFCSVCSAQCGCSFQIQALPVLSAPGLQEVVGTARLLSRGGKECQ